MYSYISSAESLGAVYIYTHTHIFSIKKRKNNLII